jgi:hypothetical protein
MNYNLKKDITKQIIEKINYIIEQYLSGKTIGTKLCTNIINKKDYDSYFNNKIKTIFDAKKDFLKQSNFNELLNDIKYLGIESFNSKIEYSNYVKELLTNILEDSIAHEKDKKNNKTMNEIVNFSKYFENKLYEIKLPVIKLDEILNNVQPIKNETFKSVLSSYFKIYTEYIDLVNKNSHYFKINDIKGDITNSSKVVFDSYIFDSNDISTIRNNIINYSIAEFLSNLPIELDVFGIKLKASSFINKDELKYTFEQNITVEETINIITNITKFKYENKFNDFYIWSNLQ